MRRWAQGHHQHNSQLPAPRSQALKSKGWHLRITEGGGNDFSWAWDGFKTDLTDLQRTESGWKSGGSAGHCPGTEKARISRMVGAVREKETSSRGMPLKAAQ